MQERAHHAAVEFREEVFGVLAGVVMFEIFG